MSYWGVRTSEARAADYLRGYRITAVWKRDAEDVDKEFEFEVAVEPPGEKEEIFATDRFAFRSPIHRFLFDVNGLATNQEGVLRATSRIREIGSQEWLSQEYEIPVRKLPAPAPSPSGAMSKQ